MGTIIEKDIPIKSFHEKIALFEFALCGVKTVETVIRSRVGLLTHDLSRGFMKKTNN